jgi:hypothetical protein
MKYTEINLPGAQTMSDIVSRKTMSHVKIIPYALFINGSSINHVIDEQLTNNAYGNLVAHVTLTLLLVLHHNTTGFTARFDTAPQHPPLTTASSFSQGRSGANGLSPPP